MATFSLSSTPAYPSVGTGSRLVLGNRRKPALEEIFQAPEEPTTTTNRETQQDTTETADRQETTDTQRRGTSETVEQGSTETREQGTQQTNVRNIDPASQAILNAMLQRLSRGEDEVTNALQQAQLDAIEQLNRSIAFNQGAVSDASGEVAALSRQFQEEFLPQLLGATEASGIGSNALTALLAQEGGIRTAEAGARAQREAAAQAGQLNNQASAIIQSLVGLGNQGNAELLDALNIAKGAIQQGTTTTDRLISGTNESVTRGTTEESATADTRTTSSGTRGTTTTDVGEESSAEAVANIQRLLNDINQSNQRDPARNLAILQSLLGPFQSVTDLVSTGLPGGPGGAARRESQRQAQALLGLIQG